MNMNARRPVVGAAILCAIAGSYKLGRAFADGIPSPSALTYTGVLLNNGMPMGSPQNIGITLYDSATSTSPLCTVPSGSVQLDSGGRFQIALPDTCTDQVHANPNVYLEVQVNGAPLSPRNRLGAVPYSVESNRSVFAQQITDGTNGIRLISGSNVKVTVNGNDSLMANSEHANNADQATFAQQLTDGINGIYLAAGSNGINVFTNGTDNLMANSAHANNADRVNGVNVFVKNGNNGTVSCSTYCLGAAFGTQGVCLGGNTASGYVDCGTVPGSDMACLCAAF